MVGQHGALPLGRQQRLVDEWDHLSKYEITILDSKPIYLNDIDRLQINGSPLHQRLSPWQGCPVPRHPCWYGIWRFLQGWVSVEVSQTKVHGPWLCTGTVLWCQFSHSCAISILNLKVTWWQAADGEERSSEPSNPWLHFQPAPAPSVWQWVAGSTIC